ncbi:outer membrane protein assembly factor BamB [Cellvibrio japonicus]|uniref:Outer membrane protein assembly factor BamB n=1 Tax=Cellvibrio japonicus (strain Ueda107) TaxID=498211 RepID=B3PDM4_CELJU|nr:outer membrane protein assembly factor BamB [Cellvibrio japonicus]ACE85358.1 PQQ enzyme repeat domain protein [Cellvibrio japonicus Ueda107]
MRPFLAMTGRWLLVVAAVSLFSGCSWFSKKTGNEPMELVDFKSSVKLDKVWSRGIGDGQSEGFTSLVPALDGDKIYAVDYKGLVVAMNAETGKKLWSRRINQQHTGLWGWIKSYFVAEDPNYQILGGIGAEKGLLLVATYAGEVMALNPESGDELWRVQLSGEILSSPRTNGTVVAAQTINGKLFGLDAKTGKQLWFYENPPPILTLRGTPSPIVLDTAIYAGFSNGRLMAFNPDNGLILWDQRIALPKGRSELERMVDIHASPLIDSGILYAGSYQGRVVAMSRGTGSPIWAKDASTSESLALANGKLFMADSDGKVIAFNASNGEVLWTNEQMLRRRLNGPQTFDQYVAVADFKGYLHILDQEKGEFAERLRVDRKGARAPMLTDGSTLYVYTNRGKLIAYRVKAAK